ncbi:hypothetical protein BC829DRAFT_439874 [Chytridium lagenaria]|nr:hypothetical protein BC829DRAFT_439874 [Chytridium lagenaria]
MLFTTLLLLTSITLVTSHGHMTTPNTSPLFCGSVTTVSGSFNVEYVLTAPHRGGCIVFVSRDGERTWEEVGKDESYDAVLRWHYITDNFTGELYNNCANIKVVNGDAQTPPQPPKSNPNNLLKSNPMKRTTSSTTPQPPNNLLNSPSSTPPTTRTTPTTPQQPPPPPPPLHIPRHLPLFNPNNLPNLPQPVLHGPTPCGPISSASTTPLTHVSWMTRNAHMAIGLVKVMTRSRFVGWEVE